MTEKHAKSSEKQPKSHGKESMHPTHQDAGPASSTVMDHETDHGSRKSEGHDPFFNETTILYGIIAVAFLLVLNQWQYLQLAQALQSPQSMIPGAGGGGSNAGGSISLGSFNLDSYSVLGPAHMMLLNGEKPALEGYKTKIIKFPTISEHPVPATTGDIAQDLINALVPTGTPWYGQEAGVSFDDPLKAKDRWNQVERETQLSPEQEQRWNNIVGSFTCDYCCGSPQNPTVINRCGCSHAGAWRGIAKFFVKNYGEKYSDSQILGEMTRWKTLWYPGPTVKRVLQEQGAAKAA